MAIRTIARSASLAGAVLLGLAAWASLAGADPGQMPDIGQPYGWWYAQGGFQGRGGGGDRQGGGARQGGGDFGGGGGDRQGGGDFGGGGGGGRRGGPGGGGPGGRGGPRPPAKIVLGVSGAEAPSGAPEVYYRLTPRGGGPAEIRRARPALVSGAWQVQPSPPEGGLAEVFSRFELAGTAVYAQINVQLAPPQDAGAPVDPAAELPAGWPSIAAEPGPDGAPPRSVTTGQSVRLALSGSGTAPDRALAVEELAVGPPDPMAASGSALAWEAGEPEEDQASIRGGRLVVFVVDQGGARLTFSVTASQPRTGGRGGGGGRARGLALAGGAALVSASLAGAHRRKFKYRNRG